jgi:hypothetical protein
MRYRLHGICRKKVSGEKISALVGEPQLVVISNKRANGDTVDGEVTEERTGAAFTSA